LLLLPTLDKCPTLTAYDLSNPLPLWARHWA